MADVDEKDVDVIEEVNEDKYGPRVAQILSKFGSIPSDLVSYVSSVCSELGEGENSPAEWEAALSHVLLPILPNKEALPGVLQQLTALTVTEEGVKSDARKDGNTLCLVDPLTLGFMGKILLLRTRMLLEKGRRYGLVGENGAGKSTLMKKIANHELPGFDRSIKIMFCQADFDEQSDHMTPEEYLKATLAADGQKENKAAIEKVLTELNFTPTLRATLIGALSGGWRMRVSLARATLVKADLLLLDEPTNHLDVTAVEWLMGFLQSISICAIVISHEPHFLDAVCTDILMIKRKKLLSYSGNFTAFLRSQRDFTAEDLEKMNEKTAESGLNFRFPDPGRPIGITSTTRSVLSLKNVTFSYSAKSNKILNDVTCRLTLSSRIAVVGPNGAGKSTLVKMMVGELDPTSGHVWKHHNLVTAYVAQHSFDHLEKYKNKPVLQYIKNRFSRGYDGESTAYKPKDENETFVTTFDIRSGTVEELLGRRKYRNALAYEVKWVGKDESENTWEDVQTLRKLGAARLIEQCDERIRSKKSGLDQRPLTNVEITRHLMDFGLDKQYAMSKIENLSGGQRCKLVLAAALWVKPHVLILDEPTNYLDLEALGALSRAIQKFKGGLVMVSHNQEFMAEICNEKWTMGEGKLVQEMGIAKPEKPKSSKREGGDGLVRGREASHRTSSIRMSGTEETLGSILGKDGLRSGTHSERVEAAKDLLNIIQTDPAFGKPEELKHIVSSCCEVLFVSTSQELWDLGLEICTALDKKFGTANAKDLLAAVEPFLANAQASLKQSVPSGSDRKEATTESAAATPGPQYAIGEVVQALWTDKKFYKATVLKIVSPVEPIKYQVQYPDFAGKTATVPEKGAMRKQVQARLKNTNLETKEEAAPASVAGVDPTRQLAGVLTLIGKFVTHLEDQERAKSTLELLINSLSVSGVCLENDVMASKLIGGVARNIQYLFWAISVSDREAQVTTCLQRVESSSVNGLRVGAASACAYLVRDGIGLREFNIITKLNALVDSKTPNQIIAGLILFTRFFIDLGDSFEWHIGAFLPKLLTAFGNKEAAVVQAAKVTCKEVMKSLTSHGAKLMLPELLAGLGKSNWRQRIDYIQVLGSMAFCSPVMMASALPRVVPRLLQVMSEPKKEVSDAAHAALTQIASVITNPEIVPLLPSLQTALRDPFNGTKIALDQLAGTSFAHAIDPASLALIMPISIKGIKDRKPETKKTALKVVAALCALILDIRDILPYLKLLLKILKTMVFHNLPDVRVEAAKALGVLVNEVGNPEKHFPGLDDWLTQTMQSKDTTPTTMDGACRALAYILFGMHIDVLKARLPKLLELTHSIHTNVRVGHLQLLVIFNEVFGDAFGDLFLGTVLPVCLEGLCDPMLPVQEAALDGSQEFVSCNTQSQLDLILPMLEAGLSNPDYKVRTNHLQLVGTVLLNIVTTANFSMSIRFYGDGNALKEGELSNVATKEQEEEIEAAMGVERRNILFANLYLMRHDSVDTVGSMAWRVWHLVVPNERDLLNEILPTLLEQCLIKLQDNNREPRETGRKTLGALVQCTGEEGLHRIMPVLQERLNVDGLGEEEAIAQRKACCYAFSEVLRSAEKGIIGVFLNDIIFIIRDLLCDPVPQVRASASHAFRQLYKNVGSKAVERIAPHLLETMKSKKVEDPAVGEALVDGISLMLQILAKPTFFFLCRACMGTLKGIKNPANDNLRHVIVTQLNPVLLDVADQYTISAAQILARYCLDTWDCAEAHVPLFAGNLIKRDKVVMREPAKRALLTAIYYAFHFQGDAAKAKERMLAFMKSPPPGFITGEDGLLGKEAQEELAESMISFKPDVLVTEDDSKLNDLAADDGEAKEEGGEEGSAVVVHTEGAAAEGEEEQEELPAVSASEKYCPKCKHVKPKTKFSAKMVKRPDGTCKMCN